MRADVSGAKGAPVLTFSPNFARRESIARIVVIGTTVIGIVSWTRWDPRPRR
jgi:hypothetical protein